MSGTQLDTTVDFNLDHQISEEIRTARPNSEIDGVKDIFGLLKLVAYFCHIDDIQVNHRETCSADRNWYFAGHIVYNWAVAYDKLSKPFPTLQEAVHGLLNQLAFKEYKDDPLKDRLPDYYWNKAREVLATRVLNHHFHGNLP